MFKKMLKLGLLGFVIGVFIAYAITIVISAIVGGGNFSPVSPALREICNTEMDAVMLQFFLSGIMGAIFAEASLVFEGKRLGLTLQTIIHFLIISTTWCVVSYTCRWWVRFGLLAYLGIFVAIYFAIWLPCYIINLQEVKKINQRLKDMHT